MSNKPHNIAILPSPLETGASVIASELQSVIDNVHVGVFVFEAAGDSNFHCLMTNDLCNRFFAIANASPSSADFEGITGIRDGKTLFSQLAVAERAGQRITFELQVGEDKGRKFYSCQVSPVQDAVNRRKLLVGTITDRSAQIRAERTLIFNALHDALTGLPNRTRFLDEVEAAVGRFKSEEGGGDCAVLSVDLDRFQIVNESFGHTAGDELLIMIASRLKACLPEGAVLSRFNGDEFALLIKNISCIDEAIALGDALHQVTEKPFKLGDDEIYASVSIGISSTYSSNPHPEDLLRDADFAMNRAKLAGKARTEVYQRESHHHARSLFHLETQLRRTVENEELELYYQPIINLDKGTLEGYEALVRWEHPERGFVSPAEFIPIAEESGIIVPLGRWVMETACRQLVEWRAQEHAAASLSVNVNVSSIQFARDDVVALTERVLAETRLDPASLHIEVTESALMDSSEAAAQVFQRLKDMGVEIALDDFGTGYSSLSYLQNFPIDILKVDRAFVKDIDTDDETRKILEIIILLARKLNMKLVAEGIENPEHLAILKRHGAGLGQGFYFSRPLPAAEALAFAQQDFPLKIQS